MDSLETPKPAKSLPTRQIVQIILQLLVLAFLVTFCFNVLAPFIDPILWAAIFAVALYPMHQSVKRLLKGRGALASVLVTIAMIAILILPAAWLTVKTAKEAKHVLAAYRTGDITVPPPAEKVKAWPLVGQRVYNVWEEASTDLDSLIIEHPTEVKKIAAKGIGLLTSTSKGLLFLTLAIIISGVFLSYATQAGDFARRLFNKLMNSDKIDMADIAVLTIRNVVKGILGVAFIQSLLVAAGLLIAGVPYAGLWTLLALILAIVQIGTLPIAIGVIIYIWSAGSTLTAILLTIWMLAVGLLDNILKPLVMGKGAPVPMLVIFLGAIGGFMFSGFIGLFTGAVVLSLVYRLFDIWLKGTEI